MPWWGVLIVVLVAVGASALVTWLLIRRAGEKAIANLGPDLAKAREDELKAAVKAEQDARAAVAKEAHDLAERLKAVTVWYTETKAKIDEKSKEDFNRLVGDPGALDRKLDELLGKSRRDDDPTDPGSR